MKNEQTTSINVFFPTGGEQPTSLDAKAINNFFKGNYAKVWAMTQGFISTFKSYENGEICFDMITDPRCKEQDFVLSHFIASEYKNKVTLLKDATSFKANHFKAKDIIGYNVDATERDLISSYQERMTKSIAELSEKPNLIHGGFFPVRKEVPVKEQKTLNVIASTEVQKLYDDTFKEIPCYCFGKWMFLAWTCELQEREEPEIEARFLDTKN